MVRCCTYTKYSSLKSQHQNTTEDKHMHPKNEKEEEEEEK
jgi:hypothetical protein